MNSSTKSIICVIIGIIAFIGLIAFAMWVLPQYRLWNQEMRGRAELARAEWSKQVIAVEAAAVLEAERMNAQAEVVRARGMAEAMEIEGGSLTELYIMYLWVRTMAQHGNVIYVPTEGGLPILEAGRFGR